MSTANFNPFAGGELLRVAPTTGPQREIIASAQISEVANTAFNEAVSIKLSGALDPERLRNCFSDLINKHDILRATFSRNGTEICLHETSQFELECQDISHYAQPEQDSFLHDLWRNIAISPMNLEEGPLIFAWLHKLDSNTHELTIAVHHIICDGWSIGLILTELSDAYRSNRASGERTDQDISFFDYAELVDSREVSNIDNDYWIGRFDDIPANLDLPLDFSRPKHRTFEATRLDYRIDAQLTKQLPKTAAAMGVSLVNMVLAGYFVLLHRLTSNDDIVVGLPVAGQATQNRVKQIGHMVHLLPVRANLTADMPFSDLCKQVKSEVLNATEHSNFTFGKLIEAINVDRTRVPLINTIFNIDQPMDSVDFGEVTGQVRTVPRAAENFEIFLNILPSSNSLTIEATYSTALFTETTIVSWLVALERILTAATVDVDRSIGGMPLAEKAPEIVEEVNRTQSGKTHATVLEALHHHATDTPDKLGCIFNDRSWTYKEVEERSNAVAAKLADKGVGKGDVVALCVDRSDASLLAIIGIFKLGAVYLPLDPEFPESRLRYMIDDSEATALLMDASTPAFIADIDLLKLNLDESDTVGPCQDSSSGFESGLSPEDIAYIIYTSGSTGKPKGVLIQHHALINFLDSMAKAPGCEINDRLLAVTTLSFDISLLELLLPITQGATTVIADKASTKDGDKLRQLILDHEITILQATPSTWRVLLDTDWKTDTGRLKGLCGGEPLPPDLVNDLCGRLYELWNMYGPTETTIWSTCHQIRLTDNLISVGKPIDNTQIHILDSNLNPLPLSCPGELYIGGLGLAKGYHKRPELTHERYIEHPVYGRLYATGDLAKWCPGGIVQHLGRMDDQVKVRGYRIELGDIEAALAACSDVQSACAYVWELSPGDARIVGCVVPSQSAELNVVGIRKALRKLLPAYMIPQYILPIDSVPLSPSGKVDRRNLPTPELRESTILQASALANQTEEMVAAIWSDVLNSQSRIVREDNFFSLGGHSLLALQAIRKIESETGIRLTPEDIVALRLSEIAEKLTHSQPLAADATENSPANLPAAALRALSHEQARILIRQLSYPDTVCNNLPASWLLQGELVIERFEKSLTKVFERQTALRTVITQQQGKYQQAILPLKQVPVLDIIDLTNTDNPRETALAHARDLAFAPFQMLGRPLFRSTLFVLGEAQYLYAFVPHQLIFDGWSFDIFLKELEDAYLALGHAAPAKPNPLAFEFRDFAEWSTQNASLSKDTDFHKAELANILEQPRPNHEERPKGECVREILSFSEAELTTVEKCADRLGLKLYELLFSIFAEATDRSQSGNSLVLGVPVSGRHRADVINLVGSFVSTIPCKIQSPKSSVSSRIAGIGKRLEATLAHQNTTYSDIVKNTPAERVQFPEFVQASFAFQDVRNRPTSIANLTLKQIDLPRRTTEFPIEFWIRIQPGGFLGVFDCDEALVDSETTNALKANFMELIAGLDSLLLEEATQTAEPEPPIKKEFFWRRLFQ